MKERFLTKESLIHLRIFDDTYDLYCGLVEIYNASYTILHELTVKSTIIWPYKVDEQARKQCRILIDKYLQKHSSVFTKEYPRLYTNAKNTKIFSMLRVKKVNHFTFHMKIISFETFLNELFFLVAQIVYLRVQRDKPKIKREFIIDQVKEAVEESVRRAIEINPSYKKDDFIIPKDGLIVFESLSLIYCNIRNHAVVPRLYKADLISQTDQIVLPVHFCETCGRCFIGAKTLAVYQEIYGNFFVPLSREINPRSDDDFFSELRSESLLHSLGYNVIEGESSETERRELLVYLIKRGKITYFQICRDLENAIRIFNNNNTHQLAVSKWVADLKYISEYVKSKSLDQTYPQGNTSK